jgi:hypothetical protein
MLFPAANTIALSTGGSERLRLDSSGNLGLGVTPSAWGASAKALQVGSYVALVNYTNYLDLSSNVYFDSAYRYLNTNAATKYSQTSGQHLWFNAPSGTAGNAISFTQAMTLDASGRLGIGTTSPVGRLRLAGSSANAFPNAGASLWLTDTNATANKQNWAISSSGDNFTVFTGNDGYSGGENAYRVTRGSETAVGDHIWYTGATVERARLTSGGDLLVGTTSNISISGVSANHAFVASTGGRWITGFRHTTSGTPWGIAIDYSAVAPNDTSSHFLFCTDSAATRAVIRSNGGLANYQGNDVNLSDRREKTNFAPAKSYLDTICAIPVQTFNYIDQSEDDPGLTLGVVAQDVQAVAPELVSESNWGTEDDPKMRLSIYQTDLQYALMKCIQELKAQNDDLRARVAALEGTQP